LASFGYPNLSRVPIIKFKLLQKNNTMKTWTMLALKGLNLAFNNDGQIDTSKSQIEIEEAKKYLYNSLNYNPTEAWPYIKLADLVEDHKEKTKLYIQAFRIEPNPYSARYLIDKILKDNPDILDKYLT
jgi:inosine/xanthosine triphosphate pyrophosphatase family protein